MSLPEQLNFKYFFSFFSVVMIWALTAILVYAAIERIIEQDFDVDANVMLYTAAISVLFNIIMGLILHFGKTTHSHFGLSHSHGSEKTFPIDLEVMIFFLIYSF